MELCLGTGEELTESLWVRLRRQEGLGDSIMGVCYRPPNQEDQEDEALFRQIGAASHSQVLVWWFYFAEIHHNYSLTPPPQGKRGRK